MKPRKSVPAWLLLALWGGLAAGSGRAEESAAPPPAPPNAEKSPEPAPSRSADPAAADPRDQEIRELRRLIEELRRRVQELERSKPAQPAVPQPGVPQPPVPEPAVPEPELPVPPVPSPAPRPAATQLPNISIVGNLIARAGDSRAIPGRGRSHFEELEIAFQDAVSPKMRYDLFLAAEKAEEWKVGLEEGFLTATGVSKNLNLRAGRIRTPIGKFNRLHPHSWFFISQPSVSRALLGSHGLVSDGAVAEYLIPSRKLFANLEFGVWQTTAGHAHGAEEHDEEEHEEGEHEEEEGPHPEDLGFRGGQKGAFSTRLWLAREVGENRELELGLTRYWGRGDVEDFGRRMLALNALDLTYRIYPSAYQRLWLTAELFGHETRNAGGRTRVRPGGFLMGAYRWNRYWEAGFRGDYTQFPFPVEGKEYGGSLFLTRYLTEQTSLRLEYQHLNTPEFGAANGLYLQLLFGSGPHFHPLR